MSDHDLADSRLRARFEPLSHEDLLRFAEFSITAIRKGGGANELTAFMDALIASRRQPAELYGRVLQSADLMRVIMSHLALVDGGRAARTCKEWRTAWELLMPTKSTFTETEWYYGVPAELEGMVGIYDNIDYPIEAMAMDIEKDGERLYFFGSKMWRLHATALQLKENQSVISRRTNTAVAATQAEEIHSAGEVGGYGLISGKTYGFHNDSPPVGPDGHRGQYPIGAILTASHAYFLTRWRLVKMERSGEAGLSTMTMDKDVSWFQLCKAAGWPTSPGNFDGPSITASRLLVVSEPYSFDSHFLFSLAWSGDEIFVLLRCKQPHGQPSFATSAVVAMDAHLDDMRNVPLPDCIRSARQIAATHSVLIVAALRYNPSSGLSEFGAADIFILTLPYRGKDAASSRPGGALLRRIPIDEPTRDLFVAVSPSGAHFVTAAAPTRSDLSDQQQATLPTLRLFTISGVCCSKLTVPSRLQGINYLQHVDGAVLVGCKTKRPDNIVLRVALATGLTRSECKSLHQLQEQHVHLTAKEDYAYEHRDDYNSGSSPLDDSDENDGEEADEAADGEEEDDGGESEHGGLEEDD